MSDGAEALRRRLDYRLALLLGATVAGIAVGMGWAVARDPACVESASVSCPAGDTPISPSPSSTQLP